MKERRRRRVSVMNASSLRTTHVCRRSNSKKQQRELKHQTGDYKGVNLKKAETIIRVSRKESFGGYGDGKYGNPHQWSGLLGRRVFHSCARAKHRRGS